MKDKLRQVLPNVLTSRMEPADDPLDVIFPPRHETTSSQDHERAVIEQAERRMQRAYAEGGIVKFGQQMWIEFEREWIEARRGGEQLSSAGTSGSNTGSNSRAA